MTDADYACELCGYEAPVPSLLVEHVEREHGQ